MFSKKSFNTKKIYLEKIIDKIFIFICNIVHGNVLY
ncbi:hypothetical protein CP_0192 [Chlamydia pneumoniae AR39]|uniref:Uncharacterized protein n=1 Tax=Chlamydia pneumoniae TaxID=83558 RepID=Q9K2C5_CHLPN|nr:hypothetical protein CP_0192 [Chlamydia pneumoniae AR39]